MDYRLPAPGLTLDQLLEGLVNAAQGEGEHYATCGGDCAGDCEYYTERTAAWQNAVKAVAAPDLGVQTQAEGLTREESMEAYRAVSDRFCLGGRQRSRLDRSAHYGAILRAGFAAKWDEAAYYIRIAGLLD